MSKIDNEYLNELVQRFSEYKSPTEAQQLIVLLGKKEQRTKEDDKKLNVLLNAEKKLEQLNKARAETRKLLQAEKDKERKARNRRLIVWGAALTKAAENDAEMRQIMQKLFADGYVAEKDKDVVRSDLKSNQNNQSSIGFLNNLSNQFN